MTQSETIRKISNMFGMSYSLDDEAKIMQEIIESNYDIKLVAKYADAVCVGNAQNRDFLEKQLKGDWVSDEKLRQNKHKLNNPTSLGNMAYLALHAPKPYNKISRKIYRQIIEIVSGVPFESDFEPELQLPDWYIIDMIKQYPLSFTSIIIIIIITITVIIKRFM